MPKTVHRKKNKQQNMIIKEIKEHRVGTHHRKTRAVTRPMTSPAKAHKKIAKAASGIAAAPIFGISGKQKPTPIVRPTRTIEITSKVKDLSSHKAPRNEAIQVEEHAAMNRAVKRWR